MGRRIRLECVRVHVGEAVLKPFCSITFQWASPVAPRRDDGEGRDLDPQEVRDDVARVEEQDVRELLGERGEQRDDAPARVRLDVGVSLVLVEQCLEDGAVAEVENQDGPVDG